MNYNISDDDSQRLIEYQNRTHLNNPEKHIYHFPPELYSNYWSFYIELSNLRENSEIELYSDLLFQVLKYMGINYDASISLINLHCFLLEELKRDFVREFLSSLKKLYEQDNTINVRLSADGGTSAFTFCEVESNKLIIKWIEDKAAEFNNDLEIQQTVRPKKGSKAKISTKKNEPIKKEYRSFKFKNVDNIALLYESCKGKIFSASYQKEEFEKIFNDFPTNEIKKIPWLIENYTTRDYFCIQLFKFLTNTHEKWDRAELCFLDSEKIGRSASSINNNPDRKIKDKDLVNEIFQGLK